MSMKQKLSQTVWVIVIAFLATLACLVLLSQPAVANPAPPCATLEQVLSFASEWDFKVRNNEDPHVLEIFNTVVRGSGFGMTTHTTEFTFSNTKQAGRFPHPEFC